MQNTILRVFCAAVFIAVFSISGSYAGKTEQRTRGTASDILSRMPSPPAGFKWKHYKDTVFLKPQSWYEQHKSGHMRRLPISVYEASKQQFSECEPFDMGLTLQIISSCSRVKGAKAMDLGMIYLNAFLKGKKQEDLLFFDQGKSGAYQKTFCRLRDVQIGQDTIVVHKFIIANDQADTLHVFTFESPEPSWEVNWRKYGTPILNRVTILPQAD